VNIILAFLCRIRPLIPTTTGVVQLLQIPGHPLLDENALGKLSMFDMKVVAAELAQEYPWQGNQFIMQVLLKAGYAAETLLRLIRVQISLQLLFMLDVLTASGNKVNTKILLRRPPGQTCSNMRWPQERPTNSNLQLWKNALLDICPSRCKTSSIG
jgi:hypothetical protein